MHPTTYQRERRQLGEKLRELREQAGISGSQFAARHGWVQPRVSRIETGKQLPTEDDIRAWSNAAEAPTGTRDELLTMLDRARAEYATWREAYRATGGAAATQSDIGTREAGTTHLRQFQPAMIPGLLQTAAYAREILALPTGPTLHGADSGDLDEMLANRMQRQQILYDTGRHIEIVVLEAALRSRLCTPKTLAGQLDRLTATATSGTALTFGVIPFEASLPVYPLSGFSVYDEDLVVIETTAGEHQLSGSEDLANYMRFFELLRDAAVTGRDAAAVIQRALATLEEDDTQEPKNPLNPRREREDGAMQ